VKYQPQTRHALIVINQNQAKEIICKIKNHAAQTKTQNRQKIQLRQMWYKNPRFGVTEKTYETTE
jgi:hypothetical protein